MVGGEQPRVIGEREMIRGKYTSLLGREISCSYDR